MKRVFAILGSLKITVGLLLVILFVLAAGTIIESTRGAEAARVVYGSTGFFALLVAFAINLAASLVDRWPYGRYRIGFVITHTSMVVILVGALATLLLKVEGRLALWEGETAAEALVADSNGDTSSLELGFAVRLDDFEIDVYPGTSRPAMYRSRVTVIDPASGSERAAVIEMNRELSHGGFKLFQVSYNIAGGREMTVLSVSRDPGQPIVFVGYVLLIVGMLTVLATRILQRRRKVAAAGVVPVPERLPIGPARLLIVVLACLAGPVLAATPDPQTVDALRSLPVQHDGRVMPLDTMAREAVWKVTGERRWQGQDPVATVLGWTFDGRQWADAAMVEIGDPELALVVGLPARLRFGSFNQLLSSAELRDLVDGARTASQHDQPLSGVQEEALGLEQRLLTLRGFLMRQAIRAQPTSTDPVAAWAVPDSMATVADLVTLKERLAAGPPPGYPSERAMAREVRSNRVRPTRLAWWILVPSSVAAALSWRRPNRLLDRLAAGGLLIGFAVMTWGIAMRWLAAGRIPASDMYESLLFLAWGVGLFAALAALLIRNRLVIFNAGAMSALTILLADVLPLDPFIHPMPPVLSGTAWLAIHVPIIMVSYALLALAALVAHLRVGVEIFGTGRAEAAATMDEIHYWYVQVGSIMLIAGILTGSIWAASSWGRYWGWDPKEVWSLIAFLAYMAILHGRTDKWLGPFWVAAASIMAFGTILMTYVGVNYVLAAGLHSYGFGGSKVANWLMAAAAVETAFVVAGIVAHRRHRARQIRVTQPSPAPIVIEGADP